CPALAGGVGMVSVQEGSPALVAHRLGDAGELGPPLIQIVDIAVRPRRPDNLRHRIGELAEPLLAVPKGDLSQLTLAHIAEIDRQPVWRRVGMHLVPAVVRCIKMLERDRHVLFDSAAVAALQPGAEGVWVLAPMVPAEKVFPATPQQDFCLAVDVGEPPVVVECAERVGDAFQDRASALLLLSGLGLGALPLSDVPGKAAGVDELPIAPQHAGVDEDLFDRAILAAEPSWILFQLFICPQSIEDVADHVLVSVKLSDRMTDVFIPAVAEHVQFGLIGPKNCSIWTHPMQPDGRTLEKVSQLLLAPPEFVFRGLSLHELP